MRKDLLIYIVAFVALGFSSCSEYSKILKSDDYNLKYEKALGYYEAGDCYKAATLWEELMTYYRMTERGENVYYYYANTQMCMKEYYLASYYFKRFVKNYPNSPRIEECSFNAAMCNLKNSPNYNLDQSDTKDAIEEFQSFMNRYPESELVDSCNVLIAGLRDKLERKSFEMAKLYFKMEKYRSAVIAFESTMEQFPDTDYKEEILFLTIKSHFLFAENSIDSKKEERYKETIDSYHTFVDSFGKSSYLKTAENYYKTSLRELDKIQNQKDGI